jgi:putative toxin-antitoxin system antitoxin component (TIGR02293 family)
LAAGSVRFNLAAHDRNIHYTPDAGVISGHSGLDDYMRESRVDKVNSPDGDIWRFDYVKCRMEVSGMPAVRSTENEAVGAQTKRVARKPTEVLLHGRNGDTRMLIIRYTQEGFDLSDVRDMISISDLYMEHDLVQRITGKSLRTVQRLAKETQPVRLNQQQSTVAFQFAQVLEHAINVFGDQQLAEDWLKKPCKYLEGHVPLELIDNSLGFQVVEDYLTRIEHGVYQ